MPIPNYKDIIDLLKKGLTVEAQEKIMALREAAMEFQEENLALKVEVAALKIQSQEKDDFEEFRGNLYYEHNVYWSMDDADQPIHAYCPTCVDSKRLKMKLASKFENGHGMVWQCNQCKFQVALTSPPKDS